MTLPPFQPVPVDGFGAATALPSPDLASLPGLRRTLAASAPEHDRAASFPSEGVDAVFRAGLLTCTVGPAYGGPGLGVAETARVLQEVGAGDPAVALVACMTLLTHAAQSLDASWPQDVYAQVLAESARGPVLLNALRVEPDLGSPSRGGLPQTVARRTADGWALTGRKIFSTGSVGLRWMAVWARTDEEEPRVGSFLVRSDAPGLRIEPTWDHLGLRASASHDVVLTDTPVPAGATAGLVAPGPGAGGQPSATLGWQVILPALYLGVARAALDWFTGFLRERVPSGLGRPLATLPRFETVVGEAEAQLAAGEEVLYGVAAGLDRGEEKALRRAGVAKLAATRAAIGAVEQLVAAAGNPGLTRANPLERHYRDVLCSRVHTPQDDAIVTTLGRAVLAAAVQQ